MINVEARVGHRPMASTITMIILVYTQIDHCFRRRTWAPKRLLIIVGIVGILSSIPTFFLHVCQETVPSPLDRRLFFTNLS